MGGWSNHHAKIREAKLDLIERQKADGSLVVRKATKQERATGKVVFQSKPTKRQS